MAIPERISQFPRPGLLEEAEDFLRLFCDENGRGEEFAPRLDEIEQEINAEGSYTHTAEELAYGAQVGWRNSTRCVGRHYWRCLKLRDFRDLETAEEMFEAIVEYMTTATNGGKIIPTIAVFQPGLRGAAPDGDPVGPRIWNEQLIRYAGYRQDDGSTLGDPRQLALTEQCMALGWEPGERTAFDVLPLVIQLAGEEPQLFELPEEAVLEVPLSHPDFPWFAELGLKWHALPAIASMRLDIGGVPYTCAPFNGWYMGAEIGARNLCDQQRYDVLPKVAREMGLDIDHDRTLWRDRAFVEVNLAVLHSFEEAGVKMVDHHTVSEHFLRFQERETDAGRSTYADWSWVVPPISGSTSPLFHHPFEDVEQSPNFFYQDDPWAAGQSGQADVCPVTGASEASNEPRREPAKGVLNRLSQAFGGG